MGRSTPVSVVVVGAGLMGRWHAAGAVRAGGRVDVVVDRDLARASSLAARYPPSVATTQLTGALQEGRRGVVHVCTPTASHEPLVSEAIEAGYHVLVEKPLAQTATTTRRLLDLAAVHRVLLCPMHQFVFQQGMLGIVGLLPQLGTIRHMDFFVCSAGADGQTDAWRDQVAFEVLPHPLSLFARVTGPRFNDLAWQVGHAAPGELRLSGLAPGMTAGIVVSMSGRPTLNQLRVVAERGSVQSDLFHGFATIERGTVSRMRKIARPISTSAVNLAAAVTSLGRRVVRREYAYPGLRELIRRFYLAVAERGPSPISAADTLAVAVARDRIILSCQIARHTHASDV